jgi:hypothetical protein
MSTWISDETGMWHPAKENVPLYNRSDKPIEIEQTSSDGKKFKKIVPPGSSYIYEGPDRAAMFQWWEENGKPSAEEMKERIGHVTFGDDFRKNTEFMEQYAKFRQMFGFNTVDDFLKYLQYDAKKLHERFLEKASMVTTHEAPARISELQKVGGGDDRANPGKNLRYGGFGDMPAV